MARGRSRRSSRRASRQANRSARQTTRQAVRTARSTAPTRQAARQAVRPIRQAARQERRTQRQENPSRVRRAVKKVGQKLRNTRVGRALVGAGPASQIARGIANTIRSRRAQRAGLIPQRKTPALQQENKLTQDVSTQEPYSPTQPTTPTSPTMGAPTKPQMNVPYEPPIGAEEQELQTPELPTGQFEQGQTGPEVDNLQGMLTDAGYDLTGEEGTFGPATQEALGAYQQEQGGAPSTYTVRSGDTLSEIAARYGVGVGDITGYRSGDPNLIFPGEVLTIGKSTQDTEPVSQPEGQPALSETEEQYSEYVKDRTYDAIYEELKDKAGIDDIKDQLDEFQKKLDDVRDRFAEESEDINNNPWISESLRLRKLNSLEQKFKIEEGNALEAFNIVQGIYEDALEEVKFAAKMAIDEQEKQQAFYQKAKTDAEKAKLLEAQIAAQWALVTQREASAGASSALAEQRRSKTGGTTSTSSIKSPFSSVTQTTSSKKTRKERRRERRSGKETSTSSSGSSGSNPFR